MSGVIENPRVLTDLEVAILRSNHALTIGDWDYMTPAQRIADIAEFWAQLWRKEGNINLIDPLDPMNRREREEANDDNGE